MTNITPVTNAVLRTLLGWLPPEDVDLDDPEYLVDAAAHVARDLNPEPTDDPKVWEITLPESALRVPFVLDELESPS